MKDETIFVQFYSRRKSSIYNLLNGFSDTWDLCRRYGDIVWLPDEVDSARWYQYEIYAAKPLPIARGTVYVSALDVNHLYQCWVWAKENPDLKIVVGGPVATERRRCPGQWEPAYIKVEDYTQMPANLVCTGKSVEEWFGEPEFYGRWRLELPPDIPRGSRIYFSYTLDNTCFWSRCIYCNIGLHDKSRIRRRERLDFEFADLPFEGDKLVRLNTGSITPRQIRDLFPVLPRGKGFQYRTFMRPSAAENEALRTAMSACAGDPPALVLGFGVEFPTQRMLNYVDKGFSPDEMLDSLATCQEHGLLANGNVIVGWDNLTEDDIREMESFMARVPQGSFKNMQLRWLFAHPFTPVHDGRDGEPVRFGPFYEGFSVYLHDAHQLELNRRAIDILEKYAPLKGYTLDGLERVRAKVAAAP